MSDFRPKDKVYVDGTGEATTIDDSDHDEPTAIGFIWINDCYGNKCVLLKSVHHDPDRLVREAVKEAIEKTSKQPKRRVDRWFNLFVDDSGGSRYFSYSSEEKAINDSFDCSGLKFIAIAQKIEVEE
jgi:hypothetical protein